MIISFDAGSFRDPEGSVFFYNDQIYRTVSKKSSKDMVSLLESGFFQD